MAGPKTYTTDQGDFYDLIALRAYNTERGQFLMHKVIEANWWARHVVQFSGGLEVAIPPAQVVTEVELVPWKVTANLVASQIGDRAPVFLGSFPRLSDLPAVDGVNVRIGDFAFVRDIGELVQAGGEQ